MKFRVHGSPSATRSTTGAGHVRARRLAAVGGAFLFAASMLVMPAASAQQRPAKTPLQNGKNFYKGQTITLLADGQPAGPYDLFARALAQYLGVYLHATVNVEDLSSGTSIAAEDIAAAAPSNGLQAGVMQLFTPISSIITATSGVNFNMEREAWINAEPPAAQVLLAASSSPYTTIQAVETSKTPIKTLVGASSGLAGALTRSLLGVTGADFQPITGYSSTTQEVTGFVRGDGALVMLPLSTAGPLMESGFAKPIATTLIPYPNTTYRNYIASTPTFKQVLKEYPAKTKTQKAAATALSFIATSPSGLLTLPTSVAADKVDAMRAAADWAYKQSGFTTLMLTDGLSPKLIDPVQAKLAFAASLKNDAALSCYILGTCG